MQPRMVVHFQSNQSLGYKIFSSIDLPPFVNNFLVSHYIIFNIFSKLTNEYYNANNIIILYLRSQPLLLKINLHVFNMINNPLTIHNINIILFSFENY